MSKFKRGDKVFAVRNCDIDQCIVLGKQAQADKHGPTRYRLIGHHETFGCLEGNLHKSYTDAVLGLADTLAWRLHVHKRNAIDPCSIKYRKDCWQTLKDKLPEATKKDKEWMTVVNGILKKAK